MAKKKIVASVTLPVTTSIIMDVEMEIDDDLEVEERDKLILEEARRRALFQLLVDKEGRENGIELGDEVAVHADSVVRGNYCRAACMDASVDFVEEDD